ncbi:hypothetical protein CALVIDRAFT_536194 [Calocera viscosa TUFC12733]|uniref:Uncharacterized protein n=1 Tax=Calocera viscosa (strain TUFC12733) TaxID=1330018 RepID=A0A167NE17_CALVF|nr:hypothetical protein CALVIDRAFT_536194 [Calocera viscosa TUFC12733]
MGIECRVSALGATRCAAVGGALPEEKCSGTGARLAPDLVKQSPRRRCRTRVSCSVLRAAQQSVRSEQLLRSLLPEWC